MQFNPAVSRPFQIIQEQQPQSLAAAITRAKSKQSYYIVRYLVDHDRNSEAYQAYAYFRWVDDCLDEQFNNRSERIAFVKRQRSIMERGYRDKWLGEISEEECMLATLIKSDEGESSRLHSYIHNMMSVMEFDARRRGSLISEKELTSYTRHLAVAVTDALHHFIGHGCFSPEVEDRHLAAAGAHIAHMLRDTMDDLQAGYFNIPREVLEKHRITPWDVNSEPYRAWVKGRVNLARTYFNAGREYLSKVQNIRCRIAGYTYIGRFEPVLDAIEREDFYLREEYHEYKTPGAALKMLLSALSQAFLQQRAEITSPEWRTEGRFSKVEVRNHEL